MKYYIALSLLKNDRGSIKKITSRGILLLRQEVLYSGLQ